MALGPIIGKAGKEIQDAAMKQLGVPQADASVSSDSEVVIPRKTTHITPERWNEVHNYFFVVTESDADGIVPDNYKPLAQSEKFNFSTNVVNLVMPPQSLSVGLSFASSVVATNRGVLEENNGVVFRTINITGTTGVWKERPTESGQPSGLAATLSTKAPFLKSIAPGFLNAVSDFQKGLDRVLKPGAATENMLEEADLRNTGYYNFWRLHNFFMEYAENKKKSGSGRLRLLFGCPKDNITYIVTPASFDLRRDTSNPLLYRYSISLRCWDVTSSEPSLATLDTIPDRDNITSVRSIVERIRRARRAIRQAGNIIKAVQSDINEVANAVNQGYLAVKDIVGLENDIMDFAPILRNNIDLMIANNKRQWAQLAQEAQGSGTGPLMTLFLGGNGFKASQSGSSSSSLVNSNPTGENANNDLSDSAATQVIGQLLANADFAESTSMDRLGTLPDSITEEIEREQRESQETTSEDIYTLSDKLKEVSENLAYSTGMMDAEYASIYGLPVPAETDRQPTDEELILAAQIEDGRDAFLGSLASGNIYGEPKDNPFTDANNILADDAQIPTPISAFPAFYERGATLDDIARKYLGDANRAKEIAILNELRAPYIDENGFSLSIQLAAGRTFVVSDRSNLVLNQPIRIHGTSLATQRRRILAIEPIGGNQFKVTVDGAANLDQFTTATSPFLQARKPGCIGSGDVILIPSDNNPDPQAYANRKTPLFERLTFAERVFQIDFATDFESGDLAIGPDGDLVYAYGYQNALQALKALVETERGELDQHQTYGIDGNIGNTITGSLLSQIEENIRQGVLSDPRFTNAKVGAQIDGTALRIRIDAFGTNGTGLIPVEFQVSLNA